MCKTWPQICLLSLLYLKGTMNMVAHKCPRVVSLPAHVEGSEGSVQGLYKRSLLL